MLTDMLDISHIGRSCVMWWCNRLVSASLVGTWHATTTTSLREGQGQNTTLLPFDALAVSTFHWLSFHIAYKKVKTGHYRTKACPYWTHRTVSSRFMLYLASGISSTHYNTSSPYIQHSGLSPLVFLINITITITHWSYYQHSQQFQCHRVITRRV